MLTDIYYIFNKKDYFNYFFLTIFIYIFLQRTLVFNLQSLVPIIVTVAIIYFLSKNNTAKEFSDLDKHNVYISAKDNSQRVLNALKSFVIDIDKYPYLDSDRNISKDKFITDNNFIYECGKQLERRFSIYLTEMEKKNNDKWEKGDINVYSQPIYTDDEEGFTKSDILHSSKYSVY